jgi:molybdate transport system ATP-binding protein
MSSGSGLDAHIGIERDDGFSLDVSVAIPPGRTVALVGPNGAGKSTVVAALGGLVPLDRGHIDLDGSILDDPTRDTFVLPPSRRIGIAFQDYVLFPHMTVAQNVAFGLRSRKISKTEAARRATNWLEHLGIEDLADRSPHNLSGGQAQRVALARALIIEPRLLLLDEPLAALDATTRVEFRRILIDHLSNFDGPSMIITHDPIEAFLLADEIHIIEAGSITQVGSPDDIRLRPRTQYIADLAGSNLISGTAHHGVITAGEHRLQIAEPSIGGSVLATIHPRAIVIGRQRPTGSSRNAWETTVIRVEHYGDRVRLQTGEPLALTAEVTPEAIKALDVIEGSRVWVSIKATEIQVTPA